MSLLFPNLFADKKTQRPKTWHPLVYYTGSQNPRHPPTMDTEDKRSSWIRGDALVGEGWLYLPQEVGGVLLAAVGWGQKYWVWWWVVVPPRMVLGSYSLVCCCWWCCCCGGGVGQRKKFALESRVLVFLKGEKGTGVLRTWKYQRSQKYITEKKSWEIWTTPKAILLSRMHSPRNWQWKCNNC